MRPDGEMYILGKSGMVRVLFIGGFKRQAQSGVAR